MLMQNLRRGVKVEPMLNRLSSLKITDCDLALRREPLKKPIGFKGSQFSERWICRIMLTGGSGAVVAADGGFAVLWADERVFLSHTEVGACSLMASVAEYGLQCARRVKFTTPLDLQDQILSQVHDYACTVTRLPDLHPAFTLHSLVALDHAAWLLFAQEHGLREFDRFILAGFGQKLPMRHSRVGCIPLVSYTTRAREVLQLADAGYFIFKIKIGARGGPREMMTADKERLALVHSLVGSRETEHTPDGKIRYYLDANGRYFGRAQVEELLDFADKRGFLGQIALFEEPFRARAGESVAGFPVVFSADESVHSARDVAGILELGFGVVALKPAGTGLSATLRVMSEALRLGALTMVADSSSTPSMLDWNKNVAARLPPLPGFRMGLMEMNGHQNYVGWNRLLEKHGDAAQPWMRPRKGVFYVNRGFYGDGGGVFSNCPRPVRVKTAS
jgi:L-alanine-DL-glutamate epimerase-like enolase superfamily enzyme